MKNNISENNSTKGLKAFNTIYIIGIVFVFIKVFENLNWISKLIKKWSLPELPFFSKVNLANSDVELSLSTYLIFAIAYTILYGFVIFGLIQLSKTTKLFAKNEIFQEEISVAFKKAGKLFLMFAFGTYIIDILLLFWAKTSIRIIDLVSTELMIFIVFGYLMYFLSDVFKKGVIIKKENDLTI